MMSKNSSNREAWRYGMMVAFLAIVMVASASHLAAQNPANKTGFTPAPTTTVMPRDFTGTWRTDNARGAGDDGGNCGTLKDEYGNPRELCEYPVSKLEPYMNGRMRAWIAFFDEPLSPRWTCVGAGVQTGLQEGYLWQFSTRPDEVVQSWEQSSWFRDIWIDGRPHPPAMEAFYHGHAIGRMEGPSVFTVDTTNFTFDVDGWDDHSHLATSVRKHLIEKYTLNSPESMSIDFTVDDPVFLIKPFSWHKNYDKTNRGFVSQWDCDPLAGLEELYHTTPQRYPDDSEFAKYNK